MRRAGMPAATTSGSLLKDVYKRQPQYKGLVKGDYYHAELRYSGRWGDPGHKGELDVVFDDDGKIAFAEFNETTMGNYLSLIHI